MEREQVRARGASTVLSHPRCIVAGDGTSAPELALAVEGGVVQGLCARVPVLRHRSSARAALALVHQGHARAPRPRAAVLRAHRANARSTSRSTGSTRPRRAAATTPTFTGLELERRRRGRLPRRCRAARAPLLRARGPHTESTRSGSSSSSRPASAPALRGIIDRLELDDDGELVVTDYKTGRVPAPDLRAEPARRRPLLRLPLRAGVRRAPGAGPAALPERAAGDHRQPTEQSIRGLRQRTSAIWTAVERACERDDFRPRPSTLCDWCAFRATARPSAATRR